MIEPPRRGGSNEYPQSVFLDRYSPVYPVLLHTGISLYIPVFEEKAVYISWTRLLMHMLGFALV